MSKEQILRAEMNLAVAHKLFDGTIEGAGRVLQARGDLRAALDMNYRDEIAAATVISSALSEFAEELIANGNGEGRVLCAIEQAKGSAKFLAREAAATGDGWTWPVQVMQSGWAAGSVEGARGKENTPHYFSPVIVAEVAQAVNGARFRRRHPETGDGSDAPELTAGWVSNGRMVGSAAVATVNLLKSETGIRSTLLAAQEAGKLDLFSVSILGYFGFKRGQIDGKPALVANSLQKFVGLDMCAEPGAGGKFLSAGPN